MRARPGATLHLAKALADDAAPAAANLMARLAQRTADPVSTQAIQDVAYVLYRTCEQAGRSTDALRFNGLGTS